VAAVNETTTTTPGLPDKGLTGDAGEAADHLLDEEHAAVYDRQLRVRVGFWEGGINGA